MDRILAIPQVTQSTSEFPKSINATSTRGSDSKARKCKTKFDGIDRFKMFKNVVLKAVGNLYGHRPAGNNYRREFAEVVVNKMVPLCVLCNLCFTTCLMVYLSPKSFGSNHVVGLVAVSCCSSILILFVFRAVLGYSHPSCFVLSLEKYVAPSFYYPS